MRGKMGKKGDNVDRGAAGHVQSAMPAGPFREP